MKKLSQITLISALAFISSCAYPLPSSGSGFIYTKVTEAVQFNNNVRISKTGEACNENILGIVATGDSTVEAATKKANIRNVASIDRSYYGILSVYAKTCTIIKGN